MAPSRFGVFLAIAQPCVPHKGPPGWALGSSSERESRGLDLKVPFEPFKSLWAAKHPLGKAALGALLA